MTATFPLRITLAALKFLGAAVLLITGSPVRGQDPAATTQTPAAPVKRTEAELKADFAAANSAREALPARTRERSDAAQKQMQLASDTAWLAFDAGKYEEAADWFARSAQLKKEGLENRRGYWEDQLTKNVPETEEKLSAKTKQFEKQLAEAPDEAKKKEIRGGLDALAKMHYVLRHATLSMLESIARDARDSASVVKYAELELETKRTELDYLEHSGAPQIDIYRKKVEVATALRGVADGQADLAHFEAAEKNLRQALVIRRALPETLPERRLDEDLGSLGHMYLYKVGDVAKAREFFEQALAEIQSTAAIREKGRNEDLMSPEVKAQMNPEELARHEESLAQNSDMELGHDTFSESLMLVNLGNAVQESGDFTAASNFYDRALKLIETLPEGGYLNLFSLFRAQLRARVLSDLADLHADSGQVDLAVKELDEAIKLKREIGQDESSANSLMQAARLLYDKEDFAKARPYVEQARQIFAGAHRLPGVMSATSFLALLARDSGQLDEAARFAEEALQLAAKTGNFGAQSGTARTLASIRLRQSKVADAQTLIEQASAADAHTHSVPDKIATLGVFGEILQAEGKNDAALEQFTEAVKMLESVRATAASEGAFADVKRNAKAYERIVGLLVKMGRGEEAFDYLNRAKSQKLRDAMPLTSVRSRDKPTQERLDQAAELESKLHATNNQLQREQAKPEADRDKTKVENLKLLAASTQGEVLRVFEEIKRSNPNWEKLISVKPKALQKAQRSIPDGVTFLQYAALGEQLYIFVVTNQALKIFTPPVKPEDLWKQIRTARRKITTGESGGALTKSLTALYDMLIAPIEPELAATKTIAFIPNQLLFYLPLQALAKKQPDGELRYLIQDKQIVYLTEADVMDAVQPPDPSKSRGGMIAVGNPTGAELPSAEVEVKKIANVFPGTEVLSGAAATKSAITSNPMQKRILHFATHGRLNSATPEKSFIQLASGETPGQEELTTGEIFGLPLQQVDLVTLSACETALGDKDPDGGEITTLAEAFSSAGATSVVASLWSVGDESTTEFMVEFYGRLAAGASKAEALQSAEIKLMKNPKYSRPLYWAPFILMGDWRAQEHTKAE
ncbi:MAG: CHAT domain-containing protein [Chthoniobacterales bacterium]